MPKRLNYLGFFLKPIHEVKGVWYERNRRKRRKLDTVEGGKTAFLPRTPYFEKVGTSNQTKLTGPEKALHNLSTGPETIIQAEHRGSRTEGKVK